MDRPVVDWWTVAWRTVSGLVHQPLKADPWWTGGPTLGGLVDRPRAEWWTKPWWTYPWWIGGQTLGGLVDRPLVDWWTDPRCSDP